MDDMKRMKELVELLNKASRAYYQDAEEIMSNFEYDALYDELLELEKKTGSVLANSPTIHVGYEIVSELPKETHASPMLSLDKTKSIEALASWLGEREGLLSWKLDGLTVVLTYREGALYKAVTRGNGEIGEVITPNAKTFKNIPLRIPFEGELVLRGEAVISYSDFEKINAEIENIDAKYKNPRNLCSGSVRQLNSEITAERHVRFYAFSLVSAEDKRFNLISEQMDFLTALGFEVVPSRRVTGTDIADAVKAFSEDIKTMDIPSDGLVLIYDDIAYGVSLGRTAKFPRNAIAFKWADEVEETTLREIEWSASRTGLINPVAIFDSVSLEGTTVSRASVHNISIVKALKLGIGDRITVYKANMIIPQISENLTGSGNLEIPSKCPVCGGATEIRSMNDTETLYCTNPDCLAKQIKSLAQFVSRDALNIDGLSEATLEKLVDAGMVHDMSDLYHLDRHKEQIVTMEGFGEKSYQKMLEAIDASRNTNLYRILYGMGIEGIGSATAKLICKYFKDEAEELMKAEEEELIAIEGIGAVTARAFVNFFANEKKAELFRKIVSELTLIKELVSTESAVSGKTFVITGSVHYYANRDALKAEIESLGGKVTGSVSKKTDYLINNDVESTSGKNKKARELGIPVLNEEAYRKLAGLM